VRRLLLLISAIVFVDTTFYAVVAPLLPHYADDLGLSKASAGVLLAAYPAGTLVGALPSGVLASRIGARRTVLCGLALLAASSIGFAFAGSELVLDLSRFVQGLGGACSWAGGLAWLVAAAPPERRGELIGVALGAAIGGALLGPVLGAAATALGTEPVFGAVAAIACALALAAATTDEPARPLEPGTPLRRALAAPRIPSGMWLVAIPGLGFGVLDVLVPLRMDELGASQAAVAATFLVAAAAEAVVSPIVGRASDRRGPLVPIRAGLACAAVLVLLVPVPEHAAVTGALLVATTAALGVFWAPAMSLLSHAAEAVGAHQGLAFGLVNLAWAAGMVVGAAGGGAIAKATTDAAPFALFALLCAGTLAVLVRRPAPVSAR
jgi:predicted MFS family arabinose efflux permease